MLEQLLRNEFGLTYQVGMLFDAEKEIGLKGKRVLEIGGALPKKLVLDHIGAKVWVGIEKQDFYKEIGGCRDSGHIISFSDYDKILDYAVVDDYAENMSDSFSEKFDAIVSFAAFEHINRLPAVLIKMHKALRPGGKLYSIYSPIWPCHCGHHLHRVVDKAGNCFITGDCPIPPFGHLLMTPPQMYEFLLSYTDEEAASEIVYNVYHSQLINRLFVEDYVHFFQLSPFTIDNICGMFPYPISDEVKISLKKAHPGRETFDIQGIRVVLSKNE